MKKILLAILLLIGVGSLTGQEAKQAYYPPKDPLVQAKLEKWQDLKFGLLMHWGPYSQWGVVESWSICSEDEGWCKRKSDNYVEYKKEYEALQTTFNPVKFNPEKWARAAKKAGMRYVVFTTKHHDGFCMFDTKYTDYKITDPKTPFHTNPKANIAKEIFKAFRAEGLWTGAYFSKPDWHSPYYWWPNFATPDRNVNYNIKKYPKRWNKFVQYTQNQIMELMTDYGPMDILWLDGGWVQKLTPKQVKAYNCQNGYQFKHVQSQDIRMDELVAKVRKKQPGLIVVDRAVKGPNQNYLTPENHVPKEMLNYPWESCIIMGGGWSYSFNAKYKSGEELVHLLIDIVAKGGNLLLNVGPSHEGTWDPDVYDRLEKIGKWMDVNSEAIYSTRKLAPTHVGHWYFTQTKDGNTRYAIYTYFSNEKIPDQLTLKGIELNRGDRLYLLGYSSRIKWKKGENGYMINLPRHSRSFSPTLYAVCFKIVN
ncbi:MAG: alpha-L-fucosidase [Bacteroidales bacterium]|nr:alpha-L-fucosidase [Bacteroidales bacterium]